MVLMDSNQLERLAVGDSFVFSGVRWAVRELNVFQDPSGYRATEWRIASARKGEYFLMREHDPAQPVDPVWYLSERLVAPKLLSQETGKNLYVQLQKSFSTNKTPPLTLTVTDTNFIFESTSSGAFTSQGESQHRTTWEYWDKTHSRNLALEFWDDGNLLVYLARVIKPQQIQDIQTGGAQHVKDRFFGEGAPRILEWICATILTLLGLIMFLLGISRP
jgi:hypothetical protein